MEYICNERLSTKAFLTTKNFGPWDIGQATEIKELVLILVALTLKANLVVAETICKEEENPETVEER